MSRAVTLASRLEHIRTLRNELRSVFNCLDEELAELESALQGLTLPELPRKLPGALRINRMTVAEAAEKVMRGKGPVTVPEVVREIQRRKLYKSRSRDFYTTVYAILLRDGRFEHVGRGTFRLVPGRPRKHRRRVTAADAVEKVLRSRDGPASVMEVMAAIEARGLYESRAKDPYATVIRALLHDRRFEKVRPGLYRLAEKPGDGNGS